MEVIFLPFIMPYYHFSVILTDGKTHSGIRQLPNRDIDQIWREYERQAQSHYGSKFKAFEVVMLSKLSPQVRDWIERQGTKPDSMQGWDGKVQPRRGKDKFEGPQLGKR